MNKIFLIENKNTEIRVINFVAQFVGVSAECISLGSDMQRDLGVTGDDGIDFISSFGDEFEIDFSEFEYCKYFDSEGFNPFDLFFPSEKKWPLRVKSLVQAAIEKKWMDTEHV
jgi:hypothetical protein